MLIKVNWKKNIQTKLEKRALTNLYFYSIQSNQEVYHSSLNSKINLWLRMDEKMNKRNQNTLENTKFQILTGCKLSLSNFIQIPHKLLKTIHILNLLYKNSENANLQTLARGSITQLLNSTT